MDDSTLRRFSPKYQVVESGCWVWTAYKDPTGYGKLRFEGRPHQAHRLAYEHYVGPIPEGFELDHLCRVRACVNPAHLEPVSHDENVWRSEWPASLNAKKTHCKHGHPFDEANTGYYKGSNGNTYRRCLTCSRTGAGRRKKAARLRRAAQKEQANV